MYIDSHCHLQLPELAVNLGSIIGKMQRNLVSHALLVSIDKNDFLSLEKLISCYDIFSGTVGVHPSSDVDMSFDEIVQFSKNKKIIGVGETGLDYSYIKDNEDLILSQQLKFRKHIQAAIVSSLPLIVHSRLAAADTLKILREEQAQKVGGVIHCFTETWEFAKYALELNFSISFSGIITFKNANSLFEIVKKIPKDKFLIETDSPYLTPVPFRGKMKNDPSNLILIAKKVAELRNLTEYECGTITRTNFLNVFTKSRNYLKYKI